MHHDGISTTPQKKALDSQVSAVTLLGKSLICLQLRAIFPTRMLHQRYPSPGDPERAATIRRGLMAAVVPLSAARRRWGKSPRCGAGLGTWQREQSCWWGWVCRRRVVRDGGFGAEEV